MRPSTSGATSAARARTLTSDPLPWYPVLVAVAYALNLWMNAGVSVFAATRSIAVSVIVASVAIGMPWAAFRNRHIGGALSMLVIGLLLSRGWLYVIGIALLGVAIPSAMVLWGRVRRAPLTWPRFTRTLNVCAAFIVVVIAASGLTTGAVASIPFDLQQGQSSVAGARASSGFQDPDIYLLLLDGYPRTDSYARLFGGDNSAFEKALAERGFTVAPNSESNYIFTQLTLTSMLHMKPLTEIDELTSVLAKRAPENPTMRHVVNDNPTFAFLRERGYRIVSSSPGYEHVALRQADVFLDDGQLNEFEYHLLRHTLLQGIINSVAPEFFADQQRHRIRSGFSHVGVVAGVDGPTFAFIHIPAPHLPVVFDGRGGPADVPPSEDIFAWDTFDAATRNAYVRQLPYLNEQVLHAVDEALQARPGRPEPIIIVMSDHGAAPRPTVAVGEDIAENHANFFAAYTPGNDTFFGDNISPVNVFPILLNELFDADFALWPDGPYRSVVAQ